MSHKTLLSAPTSCDASSASCTRTPASSWRPIHNLGQRHVQAMVKVWQRRKLSPGTIQTYLSFLRGLAMWLNKPGFIRRPGTTA